MKLFHYTTIDTLALILNNRSIKFNRLDQLDDKTECEAFSDFNPLRYIFSSSFTDDPNENIALWKMYADMERGVRLEFESSTMFSPKSTPLSKHSITGSLPTSIYTAIKSSDIINEDFILVFWEPLEDHSLGQGIYLRKINYINNIKDIYSSLIRTSPSISYSPREFGYLKSTYWQFQREVRLLIYTFPNASCQEEFNKIILYRRELKTTFILVPLSKFAIDNLNIVLSPKAPEASRLIVESLTRGLENVSIQDSVLKNKIR